MLIYAFEFVLEVLLATGATGGVGVWRFCSCLKTLAAVGFWGCDGVNGAYWLCCMFPDDAFGVIETTGAPLLGIAVLAERWGYEFIRDRGYAGEGVGRLYAAPLFIPAAGSGAYLCVCIPVAGEALGLALSAIARSWTCDGVLWWVTLPLALPSYAVAPEYLVVLCTVSAAEL